MEEQPNTNSATATATAEPPAPATAGPAPVSDVPQPPASTPPQQPEATQPKKSKKPMLPIVIAVVLGAVLIGLAVYLYTKNNKSDTTGSSNQASQTAATTASVKSADVDSVSKDLDTALSKADKVDDVSSSDLNDSSLGL